MNYIERCFAIVVKTQNYLKLDYHHVLIILASSNLQIDSEVEVIYAANKWLNYNIEEHRKFSKGILSKVCLSLLSSGKIKQIFNSSSFKINESLSKILNDSKILCPNMSSTLHRCCIQDSFHILICGGLHVKHKYRRVVKTVRGVNSDNNKIKNT